MSGWLTSKAASESFYCRTFIGLFLFVLFVTHVPIDLYDGQSLWFPGDDVHIDDKLVHCTLYSALLISAVLAWAEQMNRRWYIGCWEQLGLFVGPALIVLALIAFDEATQPFCWRSCSVMDICADLVGICLGLLICVVFRGPVISNLVDPPLPEAITPNTPNTRAHV